MDPHQPLLPGFHNIQLELCSVLPLVPVTIILVCYFQRIVIIFEFEDLSLVIAVPDLALEHPVDPDALVAAEPDESGGGEWLLKEEVLMAVGDELVLNWIAVLVNGLQGAHVPGGRQE